jgi:hypothetical protein
MRGPVGCTEAETVVHGRAEPCSHVVVADAAIEGSDALLGSLGQGAAGYVLDGAEDGVGQVARILARHANLAAVSILAHGVEAGLTLGATALDEAGLASRMAALRAIGAALAPGGTVQLFACETGNTKSLSVWLMGWIPESAAG